MPRPDPVPPGVRAAPPRPAAPAARRGAPLLVLLWAAGLAACGQGPAHGSLAETLDLQLERLATADAEKSGEIIALIADMGRRKPEVVVPRLVRALAEERLDPLHDYLRFHVDLTAVPPERHSDELARLGAILAERLTANGYLGAALRVESRRSAILVSVDRPRDAGGAFLGPAEAQAWLERGAHVGSEPGTVDLMLHVPPPGELPADLAPLGPADPDAWRALLEREHALLARALGARRPYLPAEPPFRAALMRPATPQGPPVPVLLRESPREGLRFGRDAFDVHVGVDPDRRDQFLVLRVRPNRQDDFESFTKAHQGRGLALVVNGRVELIRRLGKPLREEIRFPLGNAADPLAAAWADGILRHTAGGAYAYPVRGEAIPSTPEQLDTPIARVLVAIGPPVMGAMQELVHGQGPLRERASWILAGVVKQAAGQRERPRTP